MTTGTEDHAAAGREVPADAPARCFHCGEAVPADGRWGAEIDGSVRAMCCAGCEAAALAITGFGLGAYYRQREALAERPDAHGIAVEVMHDPEVARRYVHEADGVARANLVISGMTCVACAWLIESRLAAVPGVKRFELHYDGRRAEAAWDAEVCDLGAVCEAICGLGFDARPYSVDQRRAADAEAARALLARLGVAGVFGMQVMSVSLALYLGAAEELGMQAAFLRWAAMLLSLPVLLYSAAPFFRAAWVTLRAGALNMDVPVSIAIAAAYFGSASQVLAGHGEVYFDSVVMFTAFLLLTRWLELRARVRAAARLEALTALVPEAVNRIVEDAFGRRLEVVAALRLAVGDRIRVRPGEVIAADGIVEAGTSTVDEALLSGESLPRSRTAGDAVLAGSTNLDAPLDVRVTATGDKAFAGQLSTLVARAAGGRPAHEQPLAWLLRWFVAGVLGCAAATALYWWWQDSARVFPAVLAVLVVSCPCALAIARPAAVAAAHAALLEAGVAVLGRDALERFASVSDCVLDKTGTLTEGRLELDTVRTLGVLDRERMIAYAAALSAGASHPIAAALRKSGEQATLLAASDLRTATGRGVRGQVDGHDIVLGARAYVAEHLATPAGTDFERAPEGDGKEAWLGCDGELAGRFEFRDQLRPEAPEAVAAIRAAGLDCALLSGDRERVAASVAEQCGIERVWAGHDPAMKLERVKALQAAGHHVLMVGDGINDSAVLAGADVSVAVAEASALARQQADALLLKPRLTLLPALVRTARQLATIVQQNFAWAITYNALAVPLAMSARLPPWAAALGMSLSSLVVVVNALRIRVDE